MELEREQLRQTYRLCRLGFGILSVALVLACGVAILFLTRLFVGPWLVNWIVRTRFWVWHDTPIVWLSLVGVYLLWGRWKEPGWQRRAGLLVLMSTVDAVLWFLDHGDALGLRLSEVGHEWLRNSIGEALGWAEFSLIASLACDLMAHLGIEQAPEAGKATRSLAATGAILFLLLFFEQTAWVRGWPLQQRGVDSLESLLLYLGSRMIWTITLIQATALTITAARQTGRVLAEMDREDEEHDLLRSPSDSNFGLLRAGGEDVKTAPEWWENDRP